MATNREYNYAESTSRSTTTATTFQDKVTLSVGGSAGTWVIMWAALLDNSSTSTDARLRLYNNTDAASLAAYNWEPKDTTDRFPFSGFAVLDLPDTNTKDIRLQYSTESGTAGIQQARLFALKLTSADKYAENTGATNEAAGSETDHVSLTFTPSTTGNYLLLFSAQVSKNGVGSSIRSSAYLDGSLMGSISQLDYTASWDATNVFPVSYAYVTSLNDTSHTTKWTIFRNGGTDTVSMSNGRLIALRLDEFLETTTQVDDDHTTTSSTYQDANTLTHTPANQPYLFFDHRLMYNANFSITTASLHARTLKGGADYFAPYVVEPRSTNDEYDWIQFKVETMAASSTTWVQQLASENNVNTARSRNHIMALFQLEGASGATGSVKHYNGSTWDLKPVKAWNGSTWDTKPLKYWSGSAWITTP